jgi:outer membrane immunogenic protein
MRKLLRRGVTGIALTAAGGCAYAADMPLKAPPPAIYDWTGCYIGVHAGGGTLYTPSTANNGGGGIVGGQFGCNYQSGSIVVGIEGEGWWSGLRSALSRVDSFEQDLFRARNRWDLDIALRAGVAVDRVLIYSKVGAAWGRFDFGSDFAFGGGGGSQQATGGLTGLLLGTGLEYALTGNWTGKVEYNYIGFLGSVLHFDATGNVRPFDGTM